MSIGQKLLQLRKDKHLSQEEVADKIGVSRQTISKWETDQSIPDLDKILPLCELFEISANELLGSANSLDKNILHQSSDINEANVKNKKAFGISFGVLMYFVAIVWMVVSIPYFQFDPVLATGIFLLICGLATFFIIYVCIRYGKKVASSDSKHEKKNQLAETIKSLLGGIFCLVYLGISFYTFAWHVTWVMWVIYGLVCEIIDLLFKLGGNDNEE